MSTNDSNSGKNDLITGIVHALGLFLLGTIFVLLHYSDLGFPWPAVVIMTGMVWSGIYIAWGIMVVEQQGFVAIERFGQFYRVLEAGLNVICLPDLVDRIARGHGRGSYRLQRIDLYADEPGNEMDFIDGSAPIRAQVWYRVKKDNDQVYKWVYATRDPLNRIEEVIDGTARSLLQLKTIDEVSVNLKDISMEIRNNPEVLEALEQIGVELDEKKGFIITDIVLSKDIKQARQKRLYGQKEADQQALHGSGYANAIANIIKTVKQEAGHDIDFETARQIYEKQRGLEVLEKKGGNITFVSPGIGGVIAALDINNNNKKPEGETQ